MKIEEKKQKILNIEILDKKKLEEKFFDKKFKTNYKKKKNKKNVKDIYTKQKIC